MNKETNIIEIVKSRRYIIKALQKLLSRKERSELRKNGEFLVIDHQSEDSEPGAETINQSSKALNNNKVLKNRN